MVLVTADQSQGIRALDVYCTQDGLKKPADKFWRLAKPVKTGGNTAFELPLSSINKPLWAYADVHLNPARAPSLATSKWSMSSDIMQDAKAAITPAGPIPI
jgi:hypothetical protein